jgi:hypothetical protein
VIDPQIAAETRRMQALVTELWRLEGPHVENHIGDIAWQRFQHVRREPEWRFRIWEEDSEPVAWAWIRVARPRSGMRSTRAIAAERSTKSCLTGSRRTRRAKRCGRPRDGDGACSPLAVRGPHFRPHRALRVIATCASRSCFSCLWDARRLRARSSSFRSS